MYYLQSMQILIDKLMANVPGVWPCSFCNPLNGFKSKQLLSNSTSTFEQTLIKPTAVPFTLRITTG